MFQEQIPWNALWNGRYFVGDLEASWLPAAPGAYTFTIFINSQRIGTIGFTLIQ